MNSFGGIEPGAPCFDASLNAWVLSRYADVSAALRDPRLSASPGTGSPDRDRVANAAVREAAAHALAPQRLAAWHAETESLTHQMAAALPAAQPVDLFAQFAAPWALSLAATAAGIASSESARLAPLARQLFLAAADGITPPSSPIIELATALARKPSGLDVQSFVALSQTLPHFLAAAWLALLENPTQLDFLRATPHAMPKAVDELLRFASPSRAVFRYAATTVTINGLSLAPGSRVLLQLAAANRDPAQFPDPDRLLLARPTLGHLAFGTGPHTCAGAALIRMAAATATAALLQAAASIQLRPPVQWTGGFAIRAPQSLPVILHPRLLP